MSTPMPPAPTPDQPVTEAAPLSEIQRVVNTFIAPSKTFADIRTNARWWAPFLLSALAVMAFLFTVEKKVGYEAIVNSRFAHASFMQRAISQMSPEQKQAMIDKQLASSHSSLYTTPIVNLVITAIFAALLMLTFNFGFDAQIKYKTALAVVFYGWLPKVITALLAICVMTIGVEPDGFDMENPVTTHLGVLLGPNTDNRYLYRLLAGVDLISIWWVLLVGLGFATISRRKISTGAAIAAVASWYVLFVLVRVALSPILS